MTLAEKKGDKDKMNALKDEAESYFGIKFPPFRFGQDNRSIKANLENNTIVNSIAAIKGFSVNVGTILYECSQQNFTSFVDVLDWLDKNTIKASKVKPLIHIDYFQSFGNINELIYILDAWELFKQGEAKQIRKDTINSPVIKSILEKHCSATNKDGKQSQSYKVGEKAKFCLYELEKYIKQHPMKPPKMKERINYSMDVLGYADVATGKEEDRRRLLITDVTPVGKDEIWAYRLGTKSLGTGKTARLTLTIDLYKQNPISAGNVIYAAELYKNKTGYWYLVDYKIEE